MTFTKQLSCRASISEKKIQKTTETINNSMEKHDSQAILLEKLKKLYVKVINLEKAADQLYQDMEIISNRNI